MSPHAEQVRKIRYSVAPLLTTPAGNARSRRQGPCKRERRRERQITAARSAQARMPPGTPEKPAFASGFSIALWRDSYPVADARLPRQKFFWWGPRIFRLHVSACRTGAENSLFRRSAPYDSRRERQITAVRSAQARTPPGTLDHGGKVRASENVAGNARKTRLQKRVFHCVMAGLLPCG